MGNTLRSWTMPTNAIRLKAVRLARRYLREGYGASKARMDLGLCFNLRHSQNIGNAWTDYPLPKISDLEKNINDLYVRKYGADPINDPFALLGSTFDRSSVIWIAAGWM